MQRLVLKSSHLPCCDGCQSPNKGGIALEGENRARCGGQDFVRRGLFAEREAERIAMHPKDNEISRNLVCNTDNLVCRSPRSNSCGREHFVAPAHRFCNRPHWRLIMLGSAVCMTIGRDHLQRRQMCMTMLGYGACHDSLWLAHVQ